MSWGTTIACALALVLAGCTVETDVDRRDADELRLAPVPQPSTTASLCPSDGSLYDLAVPGTGYCSYDAGKYSEYQQMTSITCEPYVGVDGIARHVTTCSWRWEKRLKAEPTLVMFTGQDGKSCDGVATPLTPCPDHVVGADDSYTVGASGPCPAGGPPWFNDWGVDQWKECAFETIAIPALPMPSKTREASLGTCCSSLNGTCNGALDEGIDEGPFATPPACYAKTNNCKPGFVPVFPWGSPACLCHCEAPPPPAGESSESGDSSSGCIACDVDTATDDAPIPDAPIPDAGS